MGKLDHIVLLSAGAAPSGEHAVKWNWLKTVPRWCYRWRFVRGQIIWDVPMMSLPLVSSFFHRCTAEHRNSINISRGGYNQRLERRRHERSRHVDRSRKKECVLADGAYYTTMSLYFWAYLSVTI